MALRQLAGNLAGFRSVVHHHPVVKFIRQAKHGHHVVGTVGVVVHDTLPIQNLHQRVHPQVVIGLLGIFVFAATALL